MNLHLFQRGYPVTVIDSEVSKRKEYYSILSSYDGVLTGGDSKPFQLFVAQKTKESLLERLQFFAQDNSDEAQNKGYAFFKRIKGII